MNDIRKGERRMFIGKPTTELAEQFDAFKNEIFINEETGSLRLGDGINLGGHEMARQDLSNVSKQTVLNKLAPINMDRTLYVSSATGADTNTGLNSFEALGSLEEAMTRRELISGKCSIIILDSKTYDLSQGSLLDSDLTIIANDATISVTVADPLLPALVVQNGSRLDVANLVILSDAACNVLGCVEQTGSTTNATITINRYTASQTGNTLVLADETAKLNLIIRASATDYAKTNDEDLLSDDNVQINFNAEQGGGGGLADAFLPRGILSKPVGGMLAQTIDFSSEAPIYASPKFTLKAGTVLRFPDGRNSDGTPKFKDVTIASDVSTWVTPSDWSTEYAIANYMGSGILANPTLHMALYAYLDSSGDVQLRYDYFWHSTNVMNSPSTDFTQRFSEAFPWSWGEENESFFGYSQLDNKGYMRWTRKTGSYSTVVEAPWVLLGGNQYFNNELLECNTIRLRSDYDDYYKGYIPNIGASNQYGNMDYISRKDSYEESKAYIAPCDITVVLYSNWYASLQPNTKIQRVVLNVQTTSYIDQGYGTTVRTPTTDETDITVISSVVIPKGYKFVAYFNSGAQMLYHPLPWRLGKPAIQY